MLLIRLLRPLLQLKQSLPAPSSSILCDLLRRCAGLSGGAGGAGKSFSVSVSSPGSLGTSVGRFLRLTTPRHRASLSLRDVVYADWELVKGSARALQVCFHCLVRCTDRSFRLSSSIALTPSRFLFTPPSTRPLATAHSTPRSAHLGASCRPPRGLFLLRFRSWCSHSTRRWSCHQFRPRCLHGLSSRRLCGFPRYIVVWLRLSIWLIYGNWHKAPGSGFYTLQHTGLAWLTEY